MPGYARPVQYYASGIQFTPAGDVSASTVQSAIQEVDTEKAPTATGVRVYATTSARNSAIPSPTAGMVTYITATNTLESYNGSSWMPSGGATGAGGDRVFYENGQTVTTNYSISANTNAISAGPVTINSGISVTIPTGSSWVIA